MRFNKIGLSAVAISLIMLSAFSWGQAAVNANPPAETEAINNSPWTLNSNSISTTGEKASVPSLARGPDGTLHTAFKQGPIASATANEAYYSFRSDNGSTWSELNE